MEKRIFYVLYNDEDGNEDDFIIRAADERSARSAVSHLDLIAVLDIGEDGEYADGEI